MGDLTTPETQASLVERLRAIIAVVESDPSAKIDAETRKFVADMREGVGLLVDTESLLAAVLSDEAQEDPSSALGEIRALASGIRDRLDRANPEPGSS